LFWFEPLPEPDPEAARICTSPAEAMPASNRPMRWLRRSVFMARNTCGGYRFQMREEYTGRMLPMIWGLIPDLGPCFEQYPQGLKTKAESQA
jgi:hypothetical protein